MLDELLGRAELKARIEDLEAERDSLEAQLDAERERRADAASARQAAEQRVNRLEDRIAELEDRVERASEGDSEPDPRGVERLSDDRLESVLDRLASVRAEDAALSAMVPDDGPLPDAVRDALGDRAVLVDRAAPCLVYVDDAQVVSAALRPPVPPSAFAEWGDRFEVDRSWFRPDTVGQHALAVVRSDLFALGVYEGRERVDLRGFQSQVKGDHSKGGFSQKRFERRRDAQISEHLAEVRTELEDAPDPLFVVGERTLLGEFEDIARVTAPADATGDPESALATARADFWTARLTLL